MLALHKTCLLGLLTVTACGSRRVAGYLDDLNDCSTATGTTHDTTSSSGSDDDTSSSSSSSTTGDTTEASTTSPDTAASTTDSTDSTSTSDTTSPLPPACGNGILEPDAPEPEECDDGNLVPDDGCSDTCARDVLVFVSSAFYQAGDLQSLVLADALCGNLADDQALPDPLLFRAWLSDSTTHARDRFNMGRGRLVLVNGLVLADSWTSLLSGQLLHNFDVTEKSETLHSTVWTGTRPDGTAVPDAEHCDDWSSSSFTKTGHYGYSDRTTPEWTLSEQFDNPDTCNSQYHLYCLQSL